MISLPTSQGSSSELDETSDSEDELRPKRLRAREKRVVSAGDMLEESDLADGVEGLKISLTDNTRGLCVCQCRCKLRRLL